MSQPAVNAALALSTMPPATVAACIVRSSEKIRPSNFRRRRRIACSHLREKPAGFGIHRGIDDVRRHHRRQRATQPAIWSGILREDRAQAGGRPTASRRANPHAHSRGPGKCLPQLARPASSRPWLRLFASSVTTRGSRMEGAVADDAGSAVVEVEHRREAQVDAGRAQFAADQVGRFRSPRAARRAHPGPIAVPSSRIGAMLLKPLRKRCTRPPSWSTQTSSGGSRKAWISRVRAPAARATRSCARRGSRRRRADGAGARARQRSARGRRHRR